MKSMSTRSSLVSCQSSSCCLLKDLQDVRKALEAGAKESSREALEGRIHQLETEQHKQAALVGSLRREIPPIKAQLDYLGDKEAEMHSEFNTRVPVLENNITKLCVNLRELVSDMRGGRGGGGRGGGRGGGAMGPLNCVES